ncbi:Uncharacterised protein [Mycobacteroides abscessus subsp. abscessus]|nr:Uncharacterised protein [Mycobacteroides abscessus subsp. abscessus]
MCTRSPGQPAASAARRTASIIGSGPHTYRWVPSGLSRSRGPTVSQNRSREVSSAARTCDKIGVTPIPPASSR